MVNLISILHHRQIVRLEVAFNSSGLKLYIGNDQNDGGVDQIMEYDLACPFTIFAATCPPITEISDRTGIAEAQVELANRTIDLSTKSVLNRLKWIRRNKDKQNLSNQNHAQDTILWFRHNLKRSASPCTQFWLDNLF